MSCPGPDGQVSYAATTTINPADAPKETLFALHAMLGIERCVIVQTATHGMDLRVTEDALAAKGGTYLGVALLPTDVADAELRRLDRLGFRGVRYNFMPHLHQSDTLDQVMALTPRLADIGWHLQIHMDGSFIADMAPVLERAPVPVVIDHIGRVDAGLGLEQPPFQRLLRMMQSDKVWIKVSGMDRISRTGPPYADAVPFARKLVSECPDRVLWGTDWPHPHHKGPIPDEGQMVDLIADDGADRGIASQADGRQSGSSLREARAILIRRVLARYAVLPPVSRLRFPRAGQECFPHRSRPSRNSTQSGTLHFAVEARQTIPRAANLWPKKSRRDDIVRSEPRCVRVGIKADCAHRLGPGELRQ